MFFVLAFGGASAGFFTYDSHLRRVCTDKVEAVVQENVEQVSGSQAISGLKNSRVLTFAPVFQYEYKGQAYRIQSSTSHNPPKFKVGERVALLLNPSEPETFRTAGDNIIRILAIFSGGLSLIFFAVTAYIFVHTRNN